MIKIRLMGKNEDMRWMINNIICHIKDIEIVDVSDFYANRGNSEYGRIYMKVEQVSEDKLH